MSTPNQAVPSIQLSPAQVESLIKERDWLREQLLLQNRLAGVGAIASSIAHEFNNILMSLLNHSKLALKPTAKLETKNQALEKVVQGSQRGANLVGAMLGMSRTSAKKLQQVDLVQLAREVISLCEKDLSKTRVRVETLFSGPVTAMVMPALIEQVLLNLVINARQAMPNGGTVRIGVRVNPDGDVGEIRVADTGVGIPPEKLGHIFEPFYSTKDPDAEGRGGSGLGLSLCRQIIEAHQGRIRVESTPGKGTVFTLKLPLKGMTQAA